MAERYEELPDGAWEIREPPDPRLAVPATPALLKGWAGPVVVYRHGSGDPPHECVMVGASGLDGCVRVASDASHDVLSVPVAHVWLDLSRAEGRDRTRAVIAKLRHVPGASFITSLQLEHDDDGDPSRCFCLIGLAGPGRFESASWDEWGCAGLIGLDPKDDTRLVDGSRLVDALALAAVAREVLRG